MECENRFCIYWRDERCILGSITLNVYGACQSCIYADIPEDVLQQARDRLLALYERE